MSLQDKRVWLGGAGLVAVLIVLLVWFAGISPLVSSASALRAETESVQQQNTALRLKTAGLAKQKQNLDTLTASLRGALTALPIDSGLPAFTRQVSDQAGRNSVTLVSISVGTIAPAIATPQATSPAAPEAPAASGEAAAKAPAAGGPNDNPAGKLFAIRVTLVTTGTAADQAAFLKAVQFDGPRRALVLSTQQLPVASSGSTAASAPIRMTSEVTVFSAPRSPQNRAQLDKLLSGDVTG